MERFSRRRLLKVAGLGTLGFFIGSCNCIPLNLKSDIDTRELTPQVPKVTVPDNGTVITVENPHLIQPDIGLERMLVFSLKDPPATFVLFPLPSSATELGSSISGFVPFDPAFNVDTALAALQSEQADQKQKLDRLDMKKVEHAKSIFKNFNQGRDQIKVYPTPPLETDLMFILGPSQVILPGNIPSSPAIVHAKFRFTPAPTKDP